MTKSWPPRCQIWPALFAAALLWDAKHKWVNAPIRFSFSYKPPQDKTNKMTDAPSEDSDQLWHPPSLISVFAVRMKKHWALNYLLSAQCQDWADAQPDVSLRWAHMSFCWFCRAAAHIMNLFYLRCRN